MLSSGDDEKTEISITHLRRKSEEITPKKETGTSEAAERNRNSIQRRRSARGEVSSIYSLHIPKDIEFMLWSMSLLLFFAILIAFIYFLDRVSLWILIPLLSIPIIFWLIFTFAAYWTETRVYYLIKRTLNYDIIQTLRGYRQYVIRRKER
ncbi:MAG: hypothetical protein QXL78_04000 [Methanocellales archaeon]